MSRAKILFVYGHGPGYGNGHRVRTQKVAAQAADGVETRLLAWENRATLLEAVEAWRPDLVWLDKRESSAGLIQGLQNHGARVLIMDSLGRERGRADYVVESIPGMDGREGRANLMGVEWLPESQISPIDRRTAKGAVFYAGGLSVFDLAQSWCLEAAEKISKAGFPSEVASSLTIWVANPPEKAGKPRSVDFQVRLAPRLRSLGYGEVLFKDIDPNEGTAFQRDISGAMLLVGYFGLSVLEALSSGIPVLLLSPSEIHGRLTRRHLSPFSLGRIGERRAAPSWEALGRETETARRRFPLGKSFHLWSKVLGSIARYERPKACPACRKAGHSIIHRRRQANLWHCAHCGLAWLDSPVDVSIFGSDAPEHARGEYGAAYFLDEYVRAYGKTYEEDRENIYRLSDARLGVLTRYARSGALLDVGAAMGFFLDRARHRGFETHGVELSAYAAERAAKAHRMRVGDILEMELGRKFEVITLWYVIEHFRDPRALLGKIAALQDSGGILALGTPNMGGLSARFGVEHFAASSPDDHFFIFGKKSLEGMLRPLGYRLVAIRATGIHADRFRRLFPFLSRFVPAKIFMALARLGNLGDTAEYFFRKT